MSEPRTVEQEVADLWKMMRETVGVLVSEHHRMTREGQERVNALAGRMAEHPAPWRDGDG